MDPHIFARVQSVHIRLLLSSIIILSIPRLSNLEELESLRASAYKYEWET